MAGRLHTLNSYDPAALLVTFNGSCDVMVTSLTGLEQSLEMIDKVFCIASQEAEEDKVEDRDGV